MQLEIQRFLFLILPYVICTTLAAFIIWGEDIRLYFDRFFIYALLAALAQTLTNQITTQANLEVIRFIVEVVVCYTLALIVFRKPWFWTFKIYATSYLLGYLTVAISIAIVIGLLHKPFPVMMNHMSYWLTIFLPANLLGVLVAYLLRRLWTAKRSLLIGIKTGLATTPSIYVALFIQTVLFVGLSGQIGFNYLGRSPSEALLLIFGLFVIFSLSIYVLAKYASFSQGELAATQDMVSENLMEMLNTVKGQRHDFINHLQVINGLNQLDNREALDEYLSDLLSEVNRYNEILKIDNPIIAALIHAKVSQANNRGINMQVQVAANLNNIAAAIDMTRIMGNLIDNAMDAAEAAREKWIDIKIEEKNSTIVCSVTNPLQGSGTGLNRYFAPGSSSKPSHEGLGLYVCQKLCAKIQGKLEWSCENDNQVTFTLTIPQTVLD
ncbi:MAG: GHKL domain-containing protein [Deltaproteobacteria bacterium]